MLWNLLGDVVRPQEGLDPPCWGQQPPLDWRTPGTFSPAPLCSLLTSLGEAALSKAVTDAQNRYQWEESKISPALRTALIHSFPHSCVRSFGYWLTHSFIIDSFIHWLIRSLTHSLTYSLTHSFIDSLIHWLIHSLTYSLIHSLTHSFIGLFTHSFIHWLIHTLIYLFTQLGKTRKKKRQEHTQTKLE